MVLTTHQRVGDCKGTVDVHVISGIFVQKDLLVGLTQAKYMFV